jgi:hypothetical protein
MTGQVEPQSLPPRLLPTLYFSVAHVALVLAFAAIAADARAVTGFYYHSRMLAIVHLVTLGWITSSILGALYLVGPVAFRVTIRASWLDYVAFALVATGVLGMVAHFWIVEPGGMAWSTPMVAFGILLAGTRLLPVLFRSRVPRAVIAHVTLAFVNIAGASTFGVLIAFDKVYGFLPGYVLTNVFAHAHLAAVGWASLMVHAKVAERRDRAGELPARNRHPHPALDEHRFGMGAHVRPSTSTAASATARPRRRREARPRACGRRCPVWRPPGRRRS